MSPPARPTREQLLAAYGATVPDLVGPGLSVLLVGINPSLWAGATGLHFGRPGNRLWVTLHAAGWTPRVLRPQEHDALLAAGIGITNLVARATARADELDAAEIRSGSADLERLVRRWEPRWVAVLGLGAFRTAYGRRSATIGPQDLTVGGRPVWLLPNPSGLNASYQQPALTAAYAALRAAVHTPDR